MDSLPAVFLGLVQGITEFLPVSSSGHLAIFQGLFGLGEAPLSYGIMLHFSTMLATLVFFGADIIHFLGGWVRGFFSLAARESEGWSVGWAVLAGTVVTGAIGLPLKPLVEHAMTRPWAVGAGLLLTASILAYGAALPANLEGRPATVARGLLIGLVQGIAVLPGISRSGSTIVAGMKTGMNPSSAFRFSFLLSVPAIFGATLLEAMELTGTPDWASTLPRGWVWGMIAAFLSGLMALGVFRSLAVRGKWRPFVIYCGAAGCLCLALPFFR